MNFPAATVSASATPGPMGTAGAAETTGVVAMEAATAVNEAATELGQCHDEAFAPES